MFIFKKEKDLAKEDLACKYLEKTVEDVEFEPVEKRKKPESKIVDTQEILINQISCVTLVDIPATTEVR